MIIHIKDKEGKTIQLSLEKTNELLFLGKLDGEEFSWTPGLNDWINLKYIDGIVIPSPPPYEPDFIFDSDEKEKTTDISIVTNDKIIANDQNLNTSKKSTKLTQSEELFGVGGWLLFFCVLCTIANPIAEFISMYETYFKLKLISNTIPNGSFYAVFEIVTRIFMTIYGFIIGIKLWNCSKKANMLALKFLYIQIAVFGLLVVCYKLFINANIHYFDSAIAKSLNSEKIIPVYIKMTLIKIAWITYFKKSIRVKNTYEIN